MEYGIKNVFRFYDAKDKQNRYYDYVHGNLRTWRLYSDVYHVPSFQIAVASLTQASDVVINLADPLDDTLVNISSYFTAGDDLYTEEFTDNAYLIYNRSKNLNTTLPEGVYYLKVTVGAVHYYSEVFAVTSLTGKLIVDYYHTNDVDTIDYTNGSNDQFVNKLIIDTKLSKPEYPYEEEGVEDGNGNFIATFQRVFKKYRFTFYAPEYITDAVSLIPLHSNITVVNDNGESTQESMTAIDFQVAGVEWNDTKGFAKIVCEFRTSAVVVTGCADNIT